MNFRNPLLVVKDIEQSKEFYKTVLGLEVITDFGANVTLTGGISLQTQRSWESLIKSSDIAFGGKDSELYFEEEDFDGFIEKLHGLSKIKYVHDVLEHRWGQRVVRILDPDMHIIEIGESITNVVRKFLADGMTVKQVAVRMDVPEEFVEGCMN